MITLRITTTTVQAKRSTVSRLYFASKMRVPIANTGKIRASAATPAFHASESEELKDAVKKISETYKLKKSDVYEKALKIKNNTI